MIPFDLWVYYGLFPRAYRLWRDGKFACVKIMQRPDGKWLAVAEPGGLHLYRGQSKNEVRAKVAIARLAR